MKILGDYYKDEKSYDLMKKYYLMAIEKDNSEAMTNLGHHYRYVEKNKNLMLKYYHMAVEKGNYYTRNNHEITTILHMHRQELHKN
jgi:TPR repeat protein